MGRPLAAVLAISACLTLSACVGGVVRSPQHCDTGHFPTKAELLSARGEPHEVDRGADEEVWIYYVEKHRWCGIAPAWGFIYPLLLPICDEYDRFTFVGEEARKAESVRIATSGAIVFLPAMQGEGKMEHGCPAHTAHPQDKAATASQPADPPPEPPVVAAAAAVAPIAPEPPSASPVALAVEQGGDPLSAKKNCDDATSEIRLRTLCLTADGCRQQIEAMRSFCANGRLSSCEVSWDALRFCERSSSAYNEKTCATAIGRVRAYCADY